MQLAKKARKPFDVSLLKKVLNIIYRLWGPFLESPETFRAYFG